MAREPQEQLLYSRRGNALGYHCFRGAQQCAKQVLSVVKVSNNRLTRHTEKEFGMMGFNTLVQLRDCLMDLFESSAVEKGLLQAVYLLETLRRLLVDGNTRMDMHGLCVC